MISILRCDPDPMYQPPPDAEDPLTEPVVSINWLTSGLLILGVLFLLILGELATMAAIRYFDSIRGPAPTAKSSSRTKHLPRIHPPMR